MKSNNYLAKFTTIFICLLCLTTMTAAQKRRTTTKKTTKPATTTAPSTPDASIVEIKNGAQNAAVQLKNVTRFIYLLGSIAQGIEDVDKEISARKASPATVDLNTKNKQGVIAGIKNLRAGIVALEIDFRAKAPLRTYVPQIGGISDIAAQAENQAAAGQLKDSGKTMLQIVDKLTDTLAAMP